MSQVGIALFLAYLSIFDCMDISRVSAADRMDETDRARITHNLVELINQANLDSILPHLLQKRVFREGMVERYRVSDNM